MQSFYLTEDEFSSFNDLVSKESGIRFGLVNRIILESKIEILMYKNGIRTIEEFQDFLHKDKSNFNVFIDTITTNLTYFFRNKRHFNFLKDVAIPNIEKIKSETIRIWSAGCATGEEPYSIAITSLEALEMDSSRVHIFASDISLKSLVKAKEGRYSKSEIVNIPKLYVEKYFDKIDDNLYIVKSFVKKMITFDYHNLMHIGPHRNMDIIFCKNVLIYFSEFAQKLTINKFYDTLLNYGYLFIGCGESLFGIDTKFIFNNIDNTVFYTKS